MTEFETQNRQIGRSMGHKIGRSTNFQIMQKNHFLWFIAFGNFQNHWNSIETGIIHQLLKAGRPNQPLANVIVSIQMTAKSA